MSILGRKLLNNSIEESFWIITLISNSSIQSIPILFQGKLFVKSNKNSLSSHDFFLTQKYIYYYDINYIIKAKISWCLLESFHEPESNDLCFGFSLINNTGRYDFYSSTVDSLESWLNYLSEICTMTGFEEDFAIIKEIDSGRYGKVFLCQDLITNAEYAVKEISKKIITNEVQIKYLRNEIEILRLVNHQNCIKLYRVYEDLVAVYLIMEYIPYENLLGRLQKCYRFTETEVSIIAKSCIELLVYFDSLGIIHRDIKLENILMCSKYNNYEFKIIDFGFATYSNKANNCKCGSPGFMAPEVLNGDYYCSKVDVYGVGVIVYALLTGKLPFQANSIEAILDKNTKACIKYENKVWKNYSQSAFDFVNSLLQKDPSLRLSAEQAFSHSWFINDLQRGKSDVITLVNSSNS